MRQTFSSFNDMPKALTTFLFSREFAEADVSLQKTYQLSDEQRTFLGDKVMDAVFADIDLPQLFADLRGSFVPTPVAEDRWSSFVEDFIKLELWPLRELLGDELASVLSEYHLRTTGWPMMRVMLKPLTFGGAASEVAAAAGFSIMGGQMRERLRDLIVTKMKGVRIDSEVRDVLMRQSDFGGLGLDAATADRALSVMNSLISTAQILTEDEYADWLAEETRKKTAPKQAASIVADEDPEIAAIRARMPAVPPVQRTVLDEAIDATYAQISSHPVDEYLDRRLKHIISSRLRDVRNPLELKQLLQRDVKVGGLGMIKDEAEKVATQIEQGYASYHDRILAEEKSHLDEQLAEQKRKVEERKQREAEEHAAWYREKVLARKQNEEDQKKLAEQMKQVLGTMQTPAAHPMDEKEKKAETARFGELVPAVAAGAVPVSTPAPALAATPTPAVASDVHASKEAAAPAQMPLAAPAAQLAHPDVKVSMATATMMATAPTSLKPRMDDVKVASPRLMGPVQELRGMTLSEFRRMAKDPNIAAQKILQKLDTLQQDSFERRVEGIRAFQESGLQKSYMSLVAESFRVGKPITELAEEKRSKGEDVPSPAELAAVISLNSKLHF